MNARPDHDSGVRRLRLARTYFLAVSVLVFGILVATLVRILTDETLERAAIMIMNVTVVVTGIVVPALLLFAVRLLRRTPSRKGAVVAGTAFVFLMLGVPMAGSNAVIVLAVAVIGIALAVIVWRAVPRDAGTWRDAHGV